MKKQTLAVLSLLAIASAAYAEDKTVTKTPDGGTVERSADTSQSQITGDTTTTHKVEAKDADGKTTLKHKRKTKRNKDGDKVKEEVDHQETHKTAPAPEKGQE